jgi:hypothetical protein
MAEKTRVFSVNDKNTIPGICITVLAIPELRMEDLLCLY